MRYTKPSVASSVDIMYTSVLPPVNNMGIATADQTIPLYVHAQYPQLTEEKGGT